MAKVSKTRRDALLNETLSEYREHFDIDIDGMTGHPQFRGTFDSFLRFQQYVQEPPRIRQRIPTSRDESSDDWAGGSWNLATRLAREGWETELLDVARSIDDIVFQVQGERESREFHLLRDVEGEAVNVPAFIIGEPEAMFAIWQDPATRVGGVVRLIVPVCGDCSIPEKLWRDRGVAISALVRTLQQEGYALEVWAHSAVRGWHGEGWRSVHLVRVQAATDPLDIGAVMYGTSHPTMLRRLMFSAMELMPPDIAASCACGEHGGGYGAPDAVRPGDLPGSVGPSITLPMLTFDSDWSHDAAVRWIHAAFNTMEGKVDAP